MIVYQRYLLYKYIHIHRVSQHRSLLRFSLSFPNSFWCVVEIEQFHTVYDLVYSQPYTPLVNNHKNKIVIFFTFLMEPLSLCDPQSCSFMNSLSLPPEINLKSLAQNITFGKHARKLSPFVHYSEFVFLERDPSLTFVFNLEIWNSASKSI